MKVSGVTWRGESVDDVEILRELPPELFRILSETNGFIVHDGALHVRGATLTPEWHSLRAAWRGKNAFHTLYENIQITDIPFAQDQVGDQFLIRGGVIFRLEAETGEAMPIAESLEAFFQKVGEDIEGFLNVGLSHRIQPGQLLLASPPFVIRASDVGDSLKPMRADEVILFHAELARQIRDIPDGGQVEFRVID